MPREDQPANLPYFTLINVLSVREVKKSTPFTPTIKILRRKLPCIKGIKHHDVLVPAHHDKISYFHTLVILHCIALSLSLSFLPPLSPSLSRQALSLSHTHTLFLFHSLPSISTRYILPVSPFSAINALATTVTSEKRSKLHASVAQAPPIPTVTALCRNLVPVTSCEPRLFDRRSYGEQRVAERRVLHLLRLAKIQPRDFRK